jgi:hypothetical protein
MLLLLYLVYVTLLLHNKLINKDKKQLAVFVPQHFSQQFLAHYLGVRLNNYQSTRKGVLLMKSIFLITAMLLSSLTFGAKYDGGVAVRVNDKAGTCININKHKISLHLRRYLLDKDSGWFSEDKEAGLLLETAVNTEKKDGSSSDKISFPKMFKADVSEHKKGIVSLPFEQRIFHRFDLSKGDNLYPSIDLTFTVLKKKKKAKFGIALEQLDKVTKSIPGSIDPFTPAFKYFVEYSNSVVTESLDAKNNVDDALKDGQLVFSFSDTDTCLADDEKTGAVAVIKNWKGKESDGVIDISKIGEYCLKHISKPANSLHFTKKVNESCNNATGFKELINPYSLYVLNAKPITASTVARSPIENESYHRCEAYGISEEDCI